jgi:hypothetical protein
MMKVPAMKVYVERNAMRPWLTELGRKGKVALMLFPYDGHNPSGVEIATPSVVTADSTWVTWDMTIPCSDMEGSAKFEQIRQIIRRAKENLRNVPAGLIGEQTEGDARHLDSAYKSGCRAFFTKDRRDMLSHAAELEELLGLRLFHPDEEERFMAFLAAANTARGEASSGNRD